MVVARGASVGGPSPATTPSSAITPFLDKRDHHEGGSSTSPLRRNQGLGRLERWDEDAMRRRRETLAARVLDPNVSQEVLNIVPQAKRLRLSLNMPFAELDDPRRIAKNVAGIGRWNDNWRQNREVAHQP